MASKKFHISPKTGEPKQCRAKTKPCPYGGAESHFGTPEMAREAYEKLQEGGSFSNAIPPKAKWVGGHYNGERDIVDGRPGYWSTSIVSGFGKTERPTFFADDAGMQDDASTLPNSLESEDWRNITREAIVSGHFAGLEDAQAEFLAYQNNEGEHAWSMGHLFDGPIAEHADEFVKRGLLGEESKYDYELYQRNFKQVPPREKFFMALTQPNTGIMSQNVMDAALVFPERDLYPVLNRLGVYQVSVSPLKNGRETGLIYTVMTPEGDTRSFALYEHRNTDALCIVGMTNWSPTEQPHGPYPKDANGKESKSNFFAELSGKTSKRQIAETLGYFLSNAQKGELESDQELVAKAERLDWTAIISEQIPAFGEFVKEQREKARKGEDINESFARWEREF